MHSDNPVCFLLDYVVSYRSGWSLVSCHMTFFIIGVVCLFNGCSIVQSWLLNCILDFWKHGSLTPVPVLKLICTFFFPFIFDIVIGVHCIWSTICAEPGYMSFFLGGGRPSWDDGNRTCNLKQSLHSLDWDNCSVVVIRIFLLVYAS